MKFQKVIGETLWQFHDNVWFVSKGIMIVSRANTQNTYTVFETEPTPFSHIFRITPLILIFQILPPNPNCHSGNLRTRKKFLKSFGAGLLRKVSWTKSPSSWRAATAAATSAAKSTLGSGFAGYRWTPAAGWSGSKAGPWKRWFSWKKLDPRIVWWRNPQDLMGKSISWVSSLSYCFFLN